LYYFKFNVIINAVSMIKKIYVIIRKYFLIKFFLSLFSLLLSFFSFFFSNKKEKKESRNYG